MELTRVERWLLANQYGILEALYPTEATTYAEHREALECGYELHYEWMCESVYTDPHTMSADECREVIDILEMFTFLKRVYQELEDKSGIEEWRVGFIGFDGNDEGKQMAYARYFCNSEGGRFDELDRGDDFNSHGPTLDRYGRMLAAWRKSQNKHELTKGDILRITSV